MTNQLITYRLPFDYPVISLMSLMSSISYVWYKTQFSVFMWRHHIPKLKITFPSEVSIPSNKRPYRTLTFHNVLARQGSSFCNRARLNFPAFTLRDTKVAVQEWVIALVFANWTVPALEETFISKCRISRAIIFRFNSKTQWQMFLLLYGRHICAPQKDTKLYKFEWHTSASNARMKNSKDLIFRDVVSISIIYRIADSWLYSLNGSGADPGFQKGGWMADHIYWGVLEKMPWLKK